MARPVKSGLNYFPMDVDMDDKVELIEAKHGITGFGILIKLYQKIYKEGYYINWKEETSLIFSKRINVDINKVNEVINDCLRYDIFSEKLYKKYSILTSSGIQKRYLTATDRRKSIDLIKSYVIADINGINVNINWINDNNSTQSKVKEIKENEIKEKNVDTRTPEEIEIMNILNNEYPKFFKSTRPLKYDDHLKLVNKFGKKEVKRIYDAMHCKADFNKKYDEPYKVALNWLKRDNPSMI